MSSHTTPQLVNKRPVVLKGVYLILLKPQNLVFKFLLCDLRVVDKPLRFWEVAYSVEVLNVLHSLSEIVVLVTGLVYEYFDSVFRDFLSVGVNSGEFFFDD